MHDPMEVIFVNKFNASQGFAISGRKIYSNFGVALATGDIDGDGFDDLIVGSQGDSSDQAGTNLQGATHIIYSRPDPDRVRFQAPLANITQLAADNESFAIFGLDRTAGFAYPHPKHFNATYIGTTVNTFDLDGDGLTDIGFGGRFATPLAVANATLAARATGLAGIFWGQDTQINGPYPKESFMADFDGANGVFMVSRNSTNSYDFTGQAVLGCDLNGDGTDELIVSSVGHDSNGLTDNGRVLIFYGGAGRRNMGLGGGYINIESLAEHVNTVNVPGLYNQGHLGHSVTCTNLNGDEYKDLVMCAPWAELSDTLRGECYVLYGTNTRYSNPFDLNSLNGLNGFRIHASRPYEYLGGHIDDFLWSGVNGQLATGDINHDGVLDLGIGSPNSQVTYNGLTRTSGRVNVLYGNRLGFDPIVDLTVLNGQNGFSVIGTTPWNATASRVIIGTKAGFAVHFTDFNGDGVDDLFIGAPGAYDSLIDLNNAGLRGQVMGLYGRDTLQTGDFPAVIPFHDIENAHLTGIEGIKFTQNIINGAGKPYQLGTILTSLDMDQDGAKDLAMGYRLTNQYTGSIYVAYGTAPVVMPAAIPSASPLPTTPVQNPEVAPSNGSNQPITSETPANGNTPTAISAPTDTSGTPETAVTSAASQGQGFLLEGLKAGYHAGEYLVNNVCNFFKPAPAASQPVAIHSADTLMFYAVQAALRDNQHKLKGVLNFYHQLEQRYATLSHYDQNWLDHLADALKDWQQRLKTLTSDAFSKVNQDLLTELTELGKDLSHMTEYVQSLAQTYSNAKTLPKTEQGNYCKSRFFTLTAATIAPVSSRPASLGLAAGHAVNQTTVLLASTSMQFIK